MISMSPFPSEKHTEFVDVKRNRITDTERKLVVTGLEAEQRRGWREGQTTL